MKKKLPYWANQLLTNKRGNVIVMTAASMPILIGSAALGIDVVQLELWKRELQRAADSAAIAGAYAVAQAAPVGTAVANDIDEHVVSGVASPAFTTPIIRTGSYAANALSSTQTCAARGVTPCFDRAVQVELSRQKRLPFIGSFTSTFNVLGARATAAIMQSGSFCLVSLYNGSSQAGIALTGGADVTLNCGASTNSTYSDAITATGDSFFTAAPLAAPGGLNGAGNNFAVGTTLQPYSAPQQDPYAYLPNPDVGSMNCSQPFPIGASGQGQPTTQAEPGCYSSMSVHGRVNLQPGVYYINGGDVTLGGQAQVTGTGVTIIMTGPAGAAGDFLINAGASLTLTAPVGGTYDGVAFYRDRRASNLDARFLGGSVVNITGSFYYPSGDIFFAGNNTTNSTCLQMVGRILEFSGNLNITNSCPPGLNAIERYVVRLVA